MPANKIKQADFHDEVWGSPSMGHLLGWTDLNGVWQERDRTALEYHYRYLKWKLGEEGSKFLQVRSLPKPAIPSLAHV